MKITLVLMTIALSLSTSAKTRNKTIYGRDNRTLFENTANKKYQKYALATAARIHNAYMFEETETSFKTWVFDLKNSTTNSCQDIRYADLPTAATCTGFLIEDDVLVTAKHCVPNSTVCEDVRWVFDYQNNKVNWLNEKEIEIPKKSIYKCAEIIDSSKDENEDWAIIRLARKTSNRPLLKLSYNEKVKDNAKLVVTGYPSGLPLIVTPDGEVIDNGENTYFKVNNDTFSGNSGSPVINQETGEVEGILVEGDRDYVFDEDKGCNVLKVCDPGECRGEKVQRIQSVVRAIL